MVYLSMKLLALKWNICIGDLKPGSEVLLTEPVGKEMLMPKDPNATIIMVSCISKLIATEHCLMTTKRILEGIRCMHAFI